MVLYCGQKYYNKKLCSKRVVTQKDCIKECCCQKYYNEKYCSKNAVANSFISKSVVIKSAVSRNDKCFVSKSIVPKVL